jgi:two-component system, response regulator PdtaR
MTLRGYDRVALVVDDEPFARLSVVQVLVDQAYVVLEAADADEALHLLERNDDVSLVVTDISMPGAMDGLSMARQLRHRDAGLALVVATGSALSEAGDLPQAAQYLQKPYAAHALLRCVRAAEAAVAPH